MPVPGDVAIAEEDTINALSPASWVYADNFVPEDEVLAQALLRGQELGHVPVSPGTGAVLSAMAAALPARAAVEIGTGAGVSGLYLLRGMPADGVLTTIDTEVENQRAAREAFTEAGIRTNRVRLIPGRAEDVLPRLADGVYDLVLLNSEPARYAEYLPQALRLLRPGGALLVDHALLRGRVADPAQRDLTTTAVREVGRAVRDDPHLLPALLPVGDGLLLAIRH